MATYKYNQEEIENMAKGRKNAMKQKPPKKKYVHTGKDLYDEFKILRVETNIKDKEVWKEIQRRKQGAEIERLRNGLIKQ